LEHIKKFILKKKERKIKKERKLKEKEKEKKEICSLVLLLH